MSDEELKKLAEKVIADLASPEEKLLFMKELNLKLEKLAEELRK